MCVCVFDEPMIIYAMGFAHICAMCDSRLMNKQTTETSGTFSSLFLDQYIIKYLFAQIVPTDLAALITTTAIGVLASFYLYLIHFGWDE